MSARTTTGILGNAGEYHVMSRLLFMGITACLAPKGAPGIDILVTDAGGAAYAAIQVKSKRGRIGSSWRLTPKAESLRSEKLFYAFVGFSESALGLVQELLIVPSEVVAEFVSLGHQQWLGTPGKDGQSHNDSTVRLFNPNPKAHVLNGKTYGPGWTKQYSENWDSIRQAVGS